MKIDLRSIVGSNAQCRRTCVTILNHDNELSNMTLLPTSSAANGMPWHPTAAQKLYIREPRMLRLSTKGSKLDLQPLN
eukprot:1147883-Amphidinium_carterae.1